MWLEVVGALVVLAVVYWLFLKPTTPTRPRFDPKPVAFDTIRPIPKLGSGGPATSKQVRKAGQVCCKILWGSQTGTAEDFAGTLAEEARTYDFYSEVEDLESYSPDDLADEQFVIFCLATYGEGEPTDNAKDFYEWLIDEARDPGSMAGVKYTVFGLGNRTYEHFNAIARVVDKRMHDLGATRVYERGEGDDDGSIQEDFDNWKSKLWAPACQAFNMPFQQVAMEASPPSYCIVEHDPDVKVSRFITWQKTVLNPLVIDVKNPHPCKVIENRELHTPKSDRSCMHLELELAPKMKYEPGDHLGIYAPNDPEEVQRLADILDLNLSRFISLHPQDNPKGRPVLGPCSVQTALEHFVDITTPPTKKLLSVLAQLYTKDPAEKERLEKLAESSEEGWEIYNEYVKNPQRTIAEILSDYPSCQPALEHLLELLPAMQPRYYSISSSMKEHSGKVHVTAVLTDYTTGTGRVHRGICTNYLRRSMPGNSLHSYVRTSTFRLPPDPSTPVILIGPGTGLAPFRGFLQERRHIDPEKRGECILFFGCRARDVDFLYQEELLAHLEDGSLTQLVTAFSREQDQKVYVQHKLKEMKDEIWKLIKAGGHVYVCGDAKNMAKDVHKILREIAQEGFGDSGEGEKYITSMQTAKPPRYQQDVWT